MVLLIVLGGLSAIAYVAVIYPSLFDKIKETIAGAGFVSFSGIIVGLYEYLSADVTWHDLVPPDKLPLLLFGLGLAGVFLRTVNLDRDVDDV